MRGSEKHLLIAVRDRLRAVCKYDKTECEIELDEMAMPTVGKLYVAVMPGGCRPGNVHAKSGGVRDLLWSANVMVVKRIREVPRDRLRNTFLLNLGSLDEEIDKIVEAVDWSYEIIAAASTELEAEDPANQGFVEPLKFVGLDEKPQLASPDLFAGAQPTVKGGMVTCGMKRIIRFGGARRVTYTRSS